MSPSEPLKIPSIIKNDRNRMNDLAKYQVAQTEAKLKKAKQEKDDDRAVYNVQVDKNLKELEKYNTE